MQAWLCLLKVHRAVTFSLWVVCRSPPRFVEERCDETPRVGPRLMGGFPLKAACAFPECLGCRPGAQPAFTSAPARLATASSALAPVSSTRRLHFWTCALHPPKTGDDARSTSGPSSRRCRPKSRTIHPSASIKRLEGPRTLLLKVFKPRSLNT